MRIQHNIAALNSYRNLTNNNTSVSKNLEKLSSGYRINRAGDDAAGLAISEKMRAQITGLETAQKNANDGISLVQTAEGALTEVHSMLNRMVELADQSANGTYQTEDRNNLQSEIQALKDEIDRISEGTNFNGINLLDGSLAGSKGASSVINGTSPVTATGGAKFSQEITFDTGKTGETQSVTMRYLDKDGNVQEASFTFAAGTDASETAKNAQAELEKIFGDGYTITTSGGKLTIAAEENGKDETQIVSVIQESPDGTTATVTMGTLTAGKDDYFQIDLSAATVDGTTTFEIDGKKFQILSRENADKLENGAIGIYVDQSSDNLSTDSVAAVVEQLKEHGVDVSVDGTDTTSINIVKGDGTNGGLTLQIGDTADEFNQMAVSVGAMDSKSLGIGNIDISTQAGAKAAIAQIKGAISKVSTTRGDLGAIQNRLEHTINNLSVTTENMTAAESRIRDVDMAKEMMAYTKNNILVQSSQAMLAQANQIPQGVLQLLQ